MSGGHYARHTLETHGKGMFSRKERGREEMKWGKREGGGGRRDGGAKAKNGALISPPLDLHCPTHHPLFADSLEAPQMQHWGVREQDKGERHHRQGNHITLKKSPELLGVGACLCEGKDEGQSLSWDLHLGYGMNSGFWQGMGVCDGETGDRDVEVAQTVGSGQVSEFRSPCRL